MISDRLLFSFIESSLLARLSYGRVLRYIAFTEQGENHGTMILDEVLLLRHKLLKGHIITYGRALL